MGWSGYSAYGVSFCVDAHGDEREQRGEKLYAECVGRISAAIRAIVSEPKYAEIMPDLYDDTD